MDTVKNLTKELFVSNRAGIHLRPAALISQTAQRFGKNTEITLRKGTYAADCRSVLDLLAIGATFSETLTLEVCGTDSQEAMDALSGLFTANFYEDTGNEEHSEGERSE